MWDHKPCSGPGQTAGEFKATTSLAAAGTMPSLWRAEADDSRHPGCEAGFAQIGQDRDGAELENIIITAFF
jgi:hypothetical protein